MRRRLRSVCLAAGALLSLSVAARAGLVDYIRRPEPEAQWSKQAEQMVGNVKIINLRLKSQVWREIPWEHTVQVFLPQEVRHPKTALLLITGGEPGIQETVLGSSIAPRIGAPFVVLYNIPNQPLFDGKSEDDLIAHTFAEYLKSGDETWPLLFPMVKSAVKAMDAVQELSRKEWPAPVEDFVVTGASKRGWTTYLTAATGDKRVRAIAPMVFDNLNFQKQMPRQLELWGEYSEQIQDYTERGLQQQMATPQGKKLVSMVDPWFYRGKLTMPKLLIHGANDRYWATDATRQYWDDLPGDKYLCTLPNAGHGLEDRNRLFGTLVAFFRNVARDRDLPKLTGKYSQSNGRVTVRMTASDKPQEVRVWAARAHDLDFRPAKWQAIPARQDGDAYVADVELPKNGGLAVFGEAEYQVRDLTYTLSIPTSVYGRRRR